ncbi:MAG: hypothetical protein AAFX09_01765 [Pseudomonadota bacterium]
MTRFLLPGFAALALFGALLASGRLIGESGWASAIGITLVVTGVLGVLNVIFFRRLKTSLDRMAETGGDGSADKDETQS